MGTNIKTNWSREALYGFLMGVLSVVIFVGAGIDELSLPIALLLMAAVGAALGLIVYAVRRTIA